MNVKVTPAMLGLALVLFTLLGPIDLLAGVGEQPELLVERDFWLDVAGAAIAAFADGFKGIVNIVATAIGLPLIRSGIAKGAPAEAASP